MKAEFNYAMFDYGFGTGRGREGERGSRERETKRGMASEGRGALSAAEKERKKGPRMAFQKKGRGEREGFSSKILPGKRLIWEYPALVPVKRGAKVLFDVSWALFAASAAAK